MNPLVLDTSAWDKLRQLGNDEFVQKMLTLFKEQAPHLIKQAEQAYQAQNFAQATSAMHQLKSSAAYVGAQQLSVLATDIEQSLTKSDSRVAVDQLKQLDSAYQAFVTAVHNKA